MRLYTVSIGETPVLVISAGVVPPLPDSLTTNPEAAKALRNIEDMRQQMLAQFPEVSDYEDESEIEEALDTWLGDDLTASGLWRGRDAVNVRKANSAESLRWHESLAKAFETGEQDAGDESWVVFLTAHTEARRARRYARR